MNGSVRKERTNGFVPNIKSDSVPWGLLVSATNMKNVLEIAKKGRGFEVTGFLIEGETGARKILAEYIHFLSPRLLPFHNRQLRSHPQRISSRVNSSVMKKEPSLGPWRRGKIGKVEAGDSFSMRWGLRSQPSESFKGP